MRREFATKVRLKAFTRSGGFCEACKARLWVGHIHYDHIIPDGQKVWRGASTSFPPGCGRDQDSSRDWRGLARQGKARSGRARQGGARLGEALQGT